MTLSGRRSRAFTTIFSALFSALAVAALAGAPGATAKPTCTDVDPTTMICQTPGHARISTSPPAQPTGPQYGWPMSGVMIGFL